MKVDEHSAKIEVCTWCHLPLEQRMWVPIEDMKIGWYVCDGRNFNIGYWNGKEFEYSRQKFNMIFKDTEYHWDIGAPYGTCKPIRYLGDNE